MKDIVYKKNLQSEKIGRIIEIIYIISVALIKKIIIENQVFK